MSESMCVIYVFQPIPPFRRGWAMEARGLWSRNEIRRDVLLAVLCLIWQCVFGATVYYKWSSAVMNGKKITCHDLYFSWIREYTQLWSYINVGKLRKLLHPRYTFRFCSSETSRWDFLRFIFIRRGNNLVLDKLWRRLNAYKTFFLNVLESTKAH